MIDEVEEWFSDLGTCAFCTWMSCQATPFIRGIFQPLLLMILLLDVPPCSRHYPTFSTSLRYSLILSSLVFTEVIVAYPFQGKIHMERSCLGDIFHSLREFVAKYGMVIDAWAASRGARSLAEERKEQIEQLPPPLEILDPPFDPGDF